MLKIAFDPVYVYPLPVGHRFPMIKYELIPEQLKHEGLVTEKNFFSPAPLLEENILLTHEKDYWHRVRDLQLSPQEVRRIGFPLSSKLIEREVRIAAGTIAGCHFASQSGVAFNVAGGTHHAGSNWGEGFCLLNDQAIAANYLLFNKLASRILIVDLDVHQGNGTAEIFQNEPRVFTLSIHAEHNFPFRKEKSDLDIGLDAGVGDEEYLRVLNKVLSDVFDRHQPDFVFFLPGVDVLATDKLGKLALTREGCKERDFAVLDLCKRKNIPVQISLGGGYSSRIIDIVEAHCNTFRMAHRIFF